MSRYVAVIRSSDMSSYQVSFPDFPGCRVEADELEKAAQVAASALRRHVQALAARGERIPEPRLLLQIRADDALAAELADAIVTTLPLLPLEASADEAPIRGGRAA